MAQAIYGVLARCDTPRAPEVVLKGTFTAIKYLGLSFLQQQLVEDVCGSKPAAKIEKWQLGTKDLCRELYKEIAGNSDQISRLFKKWGETPLTPARGEMCSEGCCYDITKMKQTPRCGSNNCYAHVETNLGTTPPAKHLKTIGEFLSASFVRSNDGLLTILAAQCLLLKGYPLPDTFITLVGAGGDGKSLLLMKLFQGVFGNAFGALPASTIQV